MGTVSAQSITMQALLNKRLSVPQYQRDYAWSAANVEALLEDTRTHAERFGLGSDYLIGEVIGCPSRNDNEVFELIDGQQRTLSTITILAAAAAFLDKVPAEHVNSEPIRRYSAQLRDHISDVEPIDITASVVPHRTPRLEHHNPEVNDTLMRFVNGEEVPVRRGGDPSQRRLAVAYRHVGKYLDRRFGELTIEELTSFQQMCQMILSHVKVVWTTVDDLEYALVAFERANNRGVALTAADLLKHILFAGIKEKEFDQVNARWTKMINKIEGAQLRIVDFMRWHHVGVEGLGGLTSTNLVSRLREPKVRRQLGLDNRALDYLSRLEESCDTLVKFTNGCTPAGTSAPAVKVFQHTALLRVRQHLPVVLAAQSWDDDAFIPLCHALERLMVVVALTRIRGQEVTPVIESAVFGIHRGNSPLMATAELGNATDLLASREARRNALEQLVMERDGNGGTHNEDFVRFLLARIHQAGYEVATKRDGNKHPQDTDVTDRPKVEDIEHIWPKSDTTAPFPVDALGNLALADKSHNSSWGSLSAVKKLKDCYHQLDSRYWVLR